MIKPKTFHSLRGMQLNSLPSVYDDKKMYVHMISVSGPPRLVYQKGTKAKHNIIALIDLEPEDLTHLALLGIKVHLNDNDLYKNVFFNGSHTIDIITGPGWYDY